MLFWSALCFYYYSERRRWWIWFMVCGKFCLWFIQITIRSGPNFQFITFQRFISQKLRVRGHKTIQQLWSATTNQWVSCLFWDFLVYFGLPVTLFAALELMFLMIWKKWEFFCFENIIFSLHCDKFVTTHFSP